MQSWISLKVDKTPTLWPAVMDDSDIYYLFAREMITVDTLCVWKKNQILLNTSKALWKRLILHSLYIISSHVTISIHTMQDLFFDYSYLF